jgi:hypothetical protein
MRDAPSPLKAEAKTAAPIIKYVPIAKDDYKRHPNDKTTADEDCCKRLDEMGDDRGQGLDAYWKWGFHTGWREAKMFYAAPVAQALPAAAEKDALDRWYLQDTRSYVGNDVLWWAKDGLGYTTDVSKAHVFQRDEAFRQAAMRGADKAWPKAYIDGKTRPAVDMQYIDHAAAIAAMQEPK